MRFRAALVASALTVYGTAFAEVLRLPAEEQAPAVEVPSLEEETPDQGNLFDPETPQPDTPPANLEAPSLDEMPVDGPDASSVDEIPDLPATGEPEEDSASPIPTDEEAPAATGDAGEETAGPTPADEEAPAEIQPEPAPRVDVPMPARGITMEAVESGFGTPRQKLAPVGEPPITRWIYPDYTVYFEGRYVIHTVPTRN